MSPIAAVAAVLGQPETGRIIIRRLGADSDREQPRLGPKPREARAKATESAP